MDFSIAIPSRDRPDLLKNLCESIYLNTHNQDNLEVIIGYDFDDMVTADAIEELSQKYKWITGYGRNRGTNLSRDYQNWMWGKSTGRFLFGLNDDCELLTNGWDKIALHRIKEYNHEIFMGWVKDERTPNNTPTHHSCSFPMLSRKAYETLGYFFHPHFTTWGADIHLYGVFKGIGRVLNLGEIVVRHNSFYQNLKPRDEISRRMEQNRNEYMGPEPEIIRLMKIINPKIKVVVKN
jgi:hypothetical protein